MTIYELYASTPLFWNVVVFIHNDIINFLHGIDRRFHMDARPRNNIKSHPSRPTYFKSLTNQSYNSHTGTCSFLQVFHYLSFASYLDVDFSLCGGMISFCIAFLYSAHSGEFTMALLFFVLPPAPMNTLESAPDTGKEPSSWA